MPRLKALPSCLRRPFRRRAQRHRRSARCGTSNCATSARALLSADDVLIDPEGPALAAVLIGGLLEGAPHIDDLKAQLLGDVVNHIRGRNGGDISQADLKPAFAPSALRRGGESRSWCENPLGVCPSGFDSLRPHHRHQPQPNVRSLSSTERVHHRCSPLSPQARCIMSRSAARTSRAQCRMSTLMLHARFSCSAARAASNV